MASTTLTYTILTGAKTVQGSIKWWANHSELYPEQILEEAQAFVYNRLRVREMQSLEAVSVADNASSFTLPTGYLAPIKLEFNGLGKIVFKREDEFPRDIDSDGDLPIGPPSFWTAMGTTAYFDAQTDEPLTGRLWMYKTPAALSASPVNETNFLTDRFPTLLRRACLAYAYEARHRTADFTTEIALVEAAIASANAEDDLARRGQEL